MKDVLTRCFDTRYGNQTGKRLRIAAGNGDTALVFTVEIGEFDSQYGGLQFVEPTVSACNLTDVAMLPAIFA